MVPVFGSEEVFAPVGDVRGDFDVKQAAGQSTFVGAFEHSATVLAVSVHVASVQSFVGVPEASTFPATTLGQFPSAVAPVYAL